MADQIINLKCPQRMFTIIGAGFGALESFEPATNRYSPRGNAGGRPSTQAGVSDTPEPPHHGYVALAVTGQRDSPKGICCGGPRHVKNEGPSRIVSDSNPTP